MNKPIKRSSHDVNPELDDRTHSLDERAAGRARVAQLLGQLIYKRWCEERQQRNKDQEPKSNNA